MRAVQSLSCASCGATITVPDDLDRITCAHCGTALTVERGAGYIASRLVEAVHTDLERVQLRQEATALELQLSTIEAEGRALRRQRPVTVVQQQQLGALERQYDALVARLMTIQTTLGVPYTHGFVRPPVAPASVPASAAQRAALCARRDALLAEGRASRDELARLDAQLAKVAGQHRTREEQRADRALARERRTAARRFQTAERAYQALVPELRLAGIPELDG